MAETTNPKGHRLDEVLGYTKGLLSPDERATFEAHLRECATCQVDLKDAGGFLTALNQEIASRRPPQRSTDAILALMAKKDSELRQLPAQRPRWMRPPAVVFGFGLAAAAVVLIAFLLQPKAPTPGLPQPPRDEMYAPQMEPDAGPHK